MREVMEKFSILPFSIRCISHSSIDVIEAQAKKPQTDQSNSSPPRELEQDQKSKTSLVLAHISKPSISERLQKLAKSIKNLPSVFLVYKEEEEEEEEDDDDEVEMEIGLPTDVQHIGHIGWDGPNNTTTVSTIKNWNTAPGFMYFPSL